MRDEKLYFGTFFPTVMQDITCEQNTGHCKTFADKSFNYIKWMNGPGDNINVPGLQFNKSNAEKYMIRIKVKFLSQK